MAMVAATKAARAAEFGRVDDRECAAKAASATDGGRLGLAFDANPSRDVRTDVICDED
jgi:hypothetical protein